jgi:hypothetical protein
MKSASTAIRAAIRSLRRKRHRNIAGFTLIEALVAFALVVAFASVLGPYLFHARRIMSGADGRIAAQFLLRELIAAPIDRANIAGALREGETAGLRWRMSAEPFPIDASAFAAEGIAERSIKHVCSGTATLDDFSRDCHRVMGTGLVDER